MTAAEPALKAETALETDDICLNVVPQRFLGGGLCTRAMSASRVWLTCTIHRTGRHNTAETRGGERVDNRQGRIGYSRKAIAPGSLGSADAAQQDA